jgi:rhodanese-related sulfurtransferase
VAAFLIARYAAADLVRQKAGPRVERLIAGVEAEGWRFVALVRLVPLFPFSLMNYALGLTRISFAQYALASLVCMTPGTLAYSWLGHAGREAAHGSTDAIRYGMLGLAVLAAIAFAPRLIRRWREAAPRWIDVQGLSKALAEGGPVAVLDVRGEDEFNGPLGHIRGALNIPMNEISDRFGELGAAKGVRVVAVCRTDKRSASAAAVLRDAGFNTEVLRGGMEAWNRALLDVERNASTDGKRRP